MHLFADKESLILAPEEGHRATYRVHIRKLCVDPRRYHIVDLEVHDCPSICRLQVDPMTEEEVLLTRASWP